MKQELKQEYKQTELGELPVEWSINKFEACLSNKKIKISKIQQLQFEKIGKYPIIDQSQELISGYWNNDKDVFASPLPVIIFGDHTRTFKFIDFPFVCGPDGTKILVPDKTRTYPLFFYYYLKSLNIPSKGYNRHYSLLKEYLVPLPPLPEQQKIAYVLSIIQEDKEKTETVINSYKELKSSLMKHLFKYGPVKFEDAEKVKLKETEIGGMPEGWGVKRLREVAENRKETVNPRENDIIYVGLEHITPGDIKLSYYGHSSQVKSSKSKFYNSDVLYAKLRPYLDKGILAELEGVCSTDIIVIKPDKKMIEPKYLAYFTHLPVFLEFSTKSMTGVNHPRTAWSTLKDFFIPLPSTAIQQQIAEILSSVDSKIEQEENKKKALEELFRSMLRNLMSAKIRVKDIEVQNEDN